MGVGFREALRIFHILCLIGHKRIHVANYALEGWKALPRVSEGSGLRLLGLGFRVQGLGFRV